MNNIDIQSPDLPHMTMVSKYEAILDVHKYKGSFIKETCHYISADEHMPFYFNDKTEPYLTVRPLTRTERRHIQLLKKEVAQDHATALIKVLDKFSEMEVLEKVAAELAKGRALK